MNDFSKELLGKDQKLFPFHSGGGCIHFGYETDHEELFWLINKADLYNARFNSEGFPEFEWLNEYPESLNDFCMFGLDFNNLSQEYSELALIIIDLIKKELGQDSKHYSFESDEWSCAFYTVYQKGICRLKDLSPKINQEIIKFCKEK